jgi:hypothetical protein
MKEYAGYIFALQAGGAKAGEGVELSRPIGTPPNDGVPMASRD